MKSTPWAGRLARSAAFFVFALLVLSVVRIAFFLHYRSADLVFSDFAPALLMGLRVDAKWLAIALSPSCLLMVPAFWKPVFWRAAQWWGAVAFGVMAVLDLVNFGFFGFYGTPISPIVFGLFQDDTTAILTTLVNDWPVFQYVLSLVILLSAPFILVRGLARLTPRLFNASVNLRGCALLTVLSLVLTAGFIRGSFGTFPLRQQDYAVSMNTFINATVPNGAAALYEAYKGQKALNLKGGPLEGLHSLGFASADEARSLLAKIRPQTPTFSAPSPQSRPHVVFAIMESMGRDGFESHVPGVNDMLGALADELNSAVVFKKGISVGTGTFVSLEGLLFDSPLTPITQSRYGQQSFHDVSRIERFKKAGYHTIFLTSGPETWRQIDANFPLQGFDEVIGAVAVHQRFPEAEIGTWGIGDEWTFKMARELLTQADARGEKLFLVLLSATNHPPHKVPDGRPVNPVSAKALPAFVTDDRDRFNPALLQTYQYACSELGKFVRAQRADSSETLIVATGDHNMRIHYEPEGVWHHAQGVPVLFWLPKSLQTLKARARPERWVSHRDLFPTISALVLGAAPAPYEGRNLFDDAPFDLAHTFTGLGKEGFALGDWGAAALLGGSALACYRWNDDRLVRTEDCSPEAQAYGDAARAQKALADYAVRSTLLSEKP